MGSLNINYIKQPDVTNAGHLFCDLFLDLDNDYKIKGNFQKSETQLTDIKVSYDQYAIRNSLNSLFNTNPGQRLLIPEYGVNLRRYIFSPVSVSSAYSIGNFLKEAIEKWEPRVTVNTISVKPLPDDNRYDIVLDLFIPTLGIRVGFLSELVQNQGISFK